MKKIEIITDWCKVTKITREREIVEVEEKVYNYIMFLLEGREISSELINSLKSIIEENKNQNK